MRKHESLELLCAGRADLLGAARAELIIGETQCGNLAYLSQVIAIVMEDPAFTMALLRIAIWVSNPASASPVKPTRF